jgi:hypothetical protein
LLHFAIAGEDFFFRLFSHLPLNGTFIFPLWVEKNYLANKNKCCEIYVGNKSEREGAGEKKV